jgi:hypothetical protein
MNVTEIKSKAAEKQAKKEKLVEGSYEYEKRVDELYMHYEFDTKTKELYCDHSLLGGNC